MKIGTENKKTTISAVALMVLAALLLFRALPRPQAQAHKSSPAPAARQYLDAALTSPTKANSHHYIAFLLKPTLDPHLRLDLLAESEGIKYGGAGRDIFTEHTEEIPKPNAPGLLTTSVKLDWQPPSPAPPPPINLKFWGWITRPGESKAAFLAQGEHGFVAHEGDIVARRYRLVKISQASIEVEDVLDNNHLTIAVAF